MVMREVRDAMAEILEHTTLAMVCRKVDMARLKQRGPTVATYQI
jgi:DNA-binding IscR family transcriptional regulator